MRLTGTLSGAPPINQQYETGPYATALLSRAFRLDVTQHSKRSATEFRGATRQCGQGRPARPEDNSRIRKGKEEDNSRTRPQARPQISGARPVWPGLVSAPRGPQQDKRRTTAGQEEDKTWPQSLAIEFRGAASQCGQFFSL